MTLQALWVCATAYGQLIINEASQGPTGAKEYVEFLVTGNPVCGSSNTVDLRGWIIDDNNSWHAAGSGTGIASGHVKFDSVANWANVKIGSLILVYNDADMSAPTAALTADETDSNNDCVYIVPVSSPLLLKNVTLPLSGSTMTTYAVAGTPYTTSGNWTPLGMANGGDAFHTVSPANYAVPYHAVGWGNNTAQVNVYYSGAQGGLVIYMANTNSNNPFDAANFINGDANTQETPGAPNNAANAFWIASLNNQCQTFTQPSVTRNLSLCPGQSIVIGGNTVSSPGTYYDTIPAVTGCDTLRTNIVTAATQVTDTNYVSLCPAQAVVINGQTVNTAGTYHDTLSGTAACDTFRTYIVSTLPFNTATQNIALCPGQQVIINGQSIQTTGTYYDTLAAVTGCDTLVTYNVTIQAYQTAAQSYTLCPGQSVTVNGNTYNASGTYTDTLPSANSCDTLLTITISVSAYQTQTFNYSFCAGDSVVINGTAYYGSTVVTDTVASANACDTIKTYQVTVTPASVQTNAVSVCQGDTYFAGGALQSTTGTYRDTLTAANGCDSIIITQLTVHGNNTVSIQQSVCAGDNSLGFAVLNDTTFTAQYTNANGCDSVVTYTITALPLPVVTVQGDTAVYEGTSATLTAGGAGTYVWSNGLTTATVQLVPPASGYYSVTGTDANQCTATDSLHIEVLRDPTAEILIPTAFSPNGDGVNDVFDIVNRNRFVITAFRIYNRWGELVHNNTTAGWNGIYKGMEQPMSTYVFYVEAYNTGKTKQFRLSGNVTLVR